jgi:dimethylglycine catabolism A
MWRPAELTRHDPTPATWPTADVAANSRLFSPIRVGPLVLAHRTWVPALVPGVRPSDVTPEVPSWYERFAPQLERITSASLGFIDQMQKRDVGGVT